MVVTFNHNKPGHMGDVWSTRDVIWNKNHFSQIACVVTQGRAWGPWVTSSMTNRLCDPQLVPLVQTTWSSSRLGREKAWWYLSFTPTTVGIHCGICIVLMSKNKGEVQVSGLMFLVPWRTWQDQMGPRTNHSTTLDREAKQNILNSRKLMNRKQRGDQTDRKVCPNREKQQTEVLLKR